MSLIDRLDLTVPVIQAPMAGVSTPQMAAAVSDAGALGSISVGATDADGAGRMIAETRALTNRPFNVNLFVHVAPRRDPGQGSRLASGSDSPVRGPRRRGPGQLGRDLSQLRR